MIILSLVEQDGRWYLDVILVYFSKIACVMVI